MIIENESLMHRQDCYMSIRLPSLAKRGWGRFETLNKYLAIKVLTSLLNPPQSPFIKGGGK